jgi:hypothetical protein
VRSTFKMTSTPSDARPRPPSLILFSLDVMFTLRAVLLCIVPILTLAVFVWPHSHESNESAGIAALLLMLICALTASRLSKHRKALDLRIPFFLNAAGGVGLLVWFAGYLTFGLWYYLTHRGAQ